MHRSFPLASMGFRIFPASMEPSEAPAPTTVCSSSMNMIIWPAESDTIFRTFFSRSSNSPLYLAPATRDARSRAYRVLFFRDSGTSPATIRRASPSTMAVLPTPGSPISTGLFFFRRERISMVRRISSSRPITGSSFPSRAFWVRSWPNFSRVLRFSSASPLFSYLSIKPRMALRVIPYFLHRFTTSVSPSSQRAASRWDAVTWFWPAAFSARANTRARPVLIPS